MAAGARRLHNVGLEIGVISPAPFAIMVVMSIVSTVMTTTLLEWIYPGRWIWCGSCVGPSAPKCIFHSIRRSPTMKKLRLHCEELRVESFPTAPSAEEPGTVNGHAATPDCAASRRTAWRPGSLR